MLTMALAPRVFVGVVIGSVTVAHVGVGFSFAAAIMTIEAAARTEASLMYTIVVMCLVS